MKNALLFECPAIRGTQGAHSHFITNWTFSTVLRLLGTIARSAIEDPERDLDNRFIGRLASALANANSTLSVSPIIVGVYSSIEFVENKTFSNCGQIFFPAGSKMEILDGLHRIAALSKAILPRYRLIKETVPVLLFSSPQPERMAYLRGCFLKSQRKKIFLKSKGYFSSRLIREMTKDLLAYSEFLNRAVATEVSSLAPRSQKLLTLSGLAKASKPLFIALHKYEAKKASILVADYWDHLGHILAPWRDYLDGKVSASKVREATILASATVVCALGKLGAHILEVKPDLWRETLQNLAVLDWHRKAYSVWEGRATNNINLLTGHRAEMLIYNSLKLACGLELNPEELMLDRELTILCDEPTRHQ